MGSFVKRLPARATDCANLRTPPRQVLRDSHIAGESGIVERLAAMDISGRTHLRPSARHLLHNRDMAKSGGYVERLASVLGG